jgi:hypothetical protein
MTPLVAMLAAAAAAHPIAPTRCSACHTAEGWEHVTFDHERTGFALAGRHRETGCADCHAGLDFKKKISTRCSSCHEDAHAGEFGARCEGCHEATGWQSRFDADAHRRTGFPLIGRHAVLACEECHLDTRDRSFSRAAVQCATCHGADFARTASTTIDHAANGFSQRCAECHGAFAFRPATFAAHEACFELSKGPHASLRCLDCHTSLRAAIVTGACATNTASCTSCHTHACARTDPIHAQVAGYQCKDRKCYECHRFAATSSSRTRFRR